MAESDKSDVNPAAVCRLLLAVEPAFVDERAIREAVGSVVVGTMPKVAELFGVSSQTVRQGWRQGGMPGKNGEWNAAEIAIWYLQRRLRQAEQRSASEPGEGGAMDKLAYREALAITRMREIKLAKEEAGVVDRHQVQSEIGAALGVLRENLLAVPRSLLPYLPAGQAEELAEEVRRSIAHSLTATVEKLTKLFACETEANPPTQDSPTKAEIPSDGEASEEKPAAKPKAKRKRAGSAKTKPGN